MLGNHWHCYVSQSEIMEIRSKNMKSIRLATITAFAVSLVSTLFGEDSIADKVKIDREPLDRSSTNAVVSYSDSLSKARPAVVNISSTRVMDTSSQLQNDPFWRFFEKARCRGKEKFKGRGLVSLFQMMDTSLQIIM